MADSRRSSCDSEISKSSNDSISSDRSKSFKHENENKLLNEQRKSNCKSPSTYSSQNLKTNTLSKNTEFGGNEIRIRNLKSKSKSPKIGETVCSLVKLEHVNDEAEPSSNSVDYKLFKFECTEDSKQTRLEIRRDTECKIGNSSTECKNKIELVNIPQNRNKRSSSTDGSPYKDKKRKKIFEELAINQPTSSINLVSMIQTSSAANQVISDSSDTRLQKPIITKIYYSYFDRTSDDNDDIKEMKYDCYFRINNLDSAIRNE